MNEEPAAHGLSGMNSQLLPSCQVFQEAFEHLPELHPRDRLHVQPVWIPHPAGLLQVDGLRCFHI